MPDISNYRPNSDRSRQQSDDKKVEKVVTGNVTTRKKPIIKKISDIFLPDDITNVREYFIMDVVLPSIKKGLHEIGQAVIDELFGGYRPVNSGGKVNYGKYYSSDSSPKKTNIRKVSDRVEYDDLFFTTRSDAERVLNDMYGILRNYQVVSIGDLYDLAGISTNNYNFNEYGWMDLRGSQIVRTRDGYLLKLPKAMPID